MHAQEVISTLATRIRHRRKMANQSAEGGGSPIPGLRDLQIWPCLPPRLLPVGLCERWDLRFTSACNPEQLEGSNTNSDWKKW